VEQIGGYRLESKLGEGGMGAVFRATNPRFPGRIFALKVLTETTDSTSLERFHREMKALSVATTHPNVVRIFGGTVEGARAFYVMELVQGKPLSSLAYENPFEPARAARIVRAIADAIAHVHHQGVIHRDLKPANVILEPNDNPRILDFGLASMAGEDRLTKTGAFLGTPSYAAPEQLDGRSHEADARADVYALGGVLHFLLTGKAPFEASSDAELLPKVLLNPAVAPSKHVPGVPVELDAVCLKALEKEARDRYRTAADFREELDRFLKGEHVLARVPGRREKLVKSLRRHRREVRIVVAAVAVIVLAAGAYGVRRSVHLARREADKKIRDEAMRATSEEALREKLALLKDADQDLRHDVEERLEAFRRAANQAFEIKNALGLDSPTRAADRDTAKLVDDAADAIVGSGSVLEIGERLLARRDEILSVPPADRAVQDRSAKLLLDATVRAASSRDDREGHALAAFAALAGACSEREPFGRGRLPDPTLSSLARDLGVAAAGTDPLAARAAGLLVDLALAAGDAERARAELEKRRAVLTPSDRGSFDRILATKLDPDELARELPAEPAAAVRRAGELARLLALAGAPGAIEHPEVLDASVIVSTARRDHSRLAPKSHTPTASDEALSEAATRLERALAALHTDVFKPVPLDAIQKAYDDVKGEQEDLIRRVLLADPRNSQGLVRAGYPLRQRLSTGPFLVLGAVESPGECLFLALAFSSLDREIMRGGNTQEFYDETIWEAPWQTFDARLAASMADDPLATLIPPARLADAAAACGALERLDVLSRAEDGSLQVEPPVRRRLALEALVGLDRLRSLSPSLAAPFAARLDRLALPAPLGERLSELELRRIEACAQDALVDRFLPSYNLVLSAAFFAAEDPAARKLGLHFELYDLAVKIVKTLSPDSLHLHNSLDYVAIRNIGKQLRDSLENDPKRHDWRKDFDSK
jgi:hypothetical protein